MKKEIPTRGPRPREMETPWRVAALHGARVNRSPLSEDVSEFVHQEFAARQSKLSCRSGADSKHLWGKEVPHGKSVQNGPVWVRLRFHPAISALAQREDHPRQRLRSDGVLYPALSKAPFVVCGGMERRVTEST